MRLIPFPSTTLCLRRFLPMYPPCANSRQYPTGFDYLSNKADGSLLPVLVMRLIPLEAWFPMLEVRKSKNFQRI